MKSRLAIIAALVSIAIGLPAKANDTRFSNRLTMVGVLTSAACVVRNGEMTEEQARELIQEIVNANLDLNTAYSWATTSDKAKEAVQIMVPYMNSECNDLTISEQEAQRLVKTCLE